LIAFVTNFIGIAPILIQSLAIFTASISGVLAARRARMDWFGGYSVAVVTSLGGGTVRDLLLGRTPVFWLSDASYIFVPIVSMISMQIIAKGRITFGIIFLFADALAMALFTWIGVNVGIKSGHTWWAVILLGAITGICGGAIRDVICNEVPIVFRRELYATSSIVGAATMLLFLNANVSPLFACSFGVGVILFLRMVSFRYKLQLPILQPASSSDSLKNV
jgi:uncharacterized membrane protein YeiH